MVLLSKKGPIWAGCVILCRVCNALFMLERHDDVRFISPNVTNSLSAEHFVVNCPKCGRKIAFFPSTSKKETVVA